MRFDNPTLAAWVGNAALATILLEAGLSTRISVFRPAFRPALALATLGVPLTAGIVGAVAMALADVCDFSSRRRPTTPAAHVGVALAPRDERRA